MEPVLIREMKRSDLDWAHDLDRRLFLDAAWEKEDMKEAFLPGRRFIVGEAGRPEGWAAMDASGAFAHILSIDVEPSFQGRGLGSSLLSSLLSSAKDMGKKKCILEVSCDNEKALGLYKKFGFKTRGRIEGYYPSSDAFVMEKDLEG